MFLCVPWIPKVLQERRNHGGHSRDQERGRGTGTPLYPVAEFTYIGYSAQKEQKLDLKKEGFGVSVSACISAGSGHWRTGVLYSQLSTSRELKINQVRTVFSSNASTNGTEMLNKWQVRGSDRYPGRFEGLTICKLGIEMIC